MCDNIGSIMVEHHHLLMLYAGAVAVATATACIAAAAAIGCVLSIERVGKDGLPRVYFGQEDGEEGDADDDDDDDNALKDSSLIGRGLCIGGGGRDGERGSGRARKQLPVHRKQLDIGFRVCDEDARDAVWKYMLENGIKCEMPYVLTLGETENTLLLASERDLMLQTTLNISIEDGEEAWRPLYVRVNIQYDSSMDVLLSVPRAGAPNTYTQYDEYLCACAMRHAFLDQVLQHHRRRRASTVVEEGHK